MFFPHLHVRTSFVDASVLMCIDYLLTYLQVTQARPMNPRKYASMLTLRNGILCKLSLEFSG